MRKINKKCVAILMLIITIFSVFQSIVFAQTEISSANIENLGDCGYHLQFWDTKQNAWSYIITTMVGYNYNGKIHYAYCLDVDKHRSRRRKCLYRKCK